jgi:hypothetical protein
MGGEHVAYMGERRGTYKVLVCNLGERENLEDLNVDRKIILKRIFKKNDEGRGMIWDKDRHRRPALFNTAMKFWAS